MMDYVKSVTTIRINIDRYYIKGGKYPEIKGDLTFTLAHPIDDVEKINEVTTLLVEYLNHGKLDLIYDDHKRLVIVKDDYDG